MTKLTDDLVRVERRLDRKAAKARLPDGVLDADVDTGEIHFGPPLSETKGISKERIGTRAHETRWRKELKFDEPSQLFLTDAQREAVGRLRKAYGDGVMLAQGLKHSGEASLSIVVHLVRDRDRVSYFRIAPDGASTTYSSMEAAIEKRPGEVIVGYSDHSGITRREGVRSTSDVWPIPEWHMHHHAMRGEYAPGSEPVPTAPCAEWRARAAEDPAEYVPQIADLERAMKELPYRERRIVDMRFGLSGHKYTLQGVADLMDVTRERVRQIESIALDKLRFIYTGEPGDVPEAPASNAAITDETMLTYMRRVLGGDKVAEVAADLECSLNGIRAALKRRGWPSTTAEIKDAATEAWREKMAAEEQKRLAETNDSVAPGAEAGSYPASVPAPLA